MDRRVVDTWRVHRRRLEVGFTWGRASRVGDGRVSTPTSVYPDPGPDPGL